MQMTDDVGYVFVEVGHRQDIHKLDEAERVGTVFALAASHYHDADLAFSIGGYDDDKRELWQIPEVMEYVRQFAKAGGLDHWRNPVITRLNQESIALLVLSNSFAPDHPFKVEHE